MSGQNSSSQTTTNTQKVRKAVLPVAGLGTRFLPATKAMPKEMLTVVDKPVVQYAVEEALRAGITEFIFVTGRGKDAIENHFDHPYELAETLYKKGKHAELEMVTNIIPDHVKIAYTRQGKPLGLGHAIACARPFVGNEPFAVLLPDDIIAEEESNLGGLIKTYEETGKSSVLTMEVSPERTKKYGILKPSQGADLQNRSFLVDGFVEKPGPEKAPSRMAVMGRYVFSPEIFDHIDALEAGYGGEIQLTDAMDTLCAQQGFSAYKMNGQRFDCGDKLGFQQANLYFALQEPVIGPALKDYLQTLFKNTQAA